MWTVTITLLIIVLCLIWVYGKWRHSYWSSRGIPGPPAFPFIGNIMSIMFFDKTPDQMNKDYLKYKDNKLYGLYFGLSPNLFIADPELIRHVMIKDFDHFTDRRVFKMTGQYDWLSEMITTLNGKEWKTLRTTLSPTFSSGKMKNMFHTVCSKAISLTEHCSKFSEYQDKISMKDIFGRYTLDVIASTAFGIECHSFGQEKSVFAEHAKSMLNMSFVKIIKFILLFILPMKILNFFKISFVDKTWDFFVNVSNETISERRKSKDKRGDFLDLLLEEQQKQGENFNENLDYRITDKTILAQSIIFLIAGFDTVASTLVFATYNLAKHQEIQEKLRQELQDIVDSDGKLDYYKLMEAKYLDACVNEAGRILPVAHVTERTCTKDYTFPNTNITIPEGLIVTVPIWGLHHDPEYWPEPDEYKPERFMPENKSAIVPNTYMPFGIGPRNCIAMRFALMEVKVALAEFVLKYKFTLAPGHEELGLKNMGSVRVSDDGLMLVLEKC